MRSPNIPSPLSMPSRCGTVSVAPIRLVLGLPDGVDLPLEVLPGPGLKALAELLRRVDVGDLEEELEYLEPSQ